MATKWWQINKWFSNADAAREAFGWIKETKTGELLDQIDDIFPVLANDIRGWKTIQDIGKFSDTTMKELYEAWDLVPEKVKGKLVPIMRKLSDYMDPATLIKIITVYLDSVKTIKSLTTG